MRTTLDIPKDLFEEAQAILGFKSKTDIVIHSLKELVRKKRREELKNSFGKIKFNIDLKKSRGK